MANVNTKIEGGGSGSENTEGKGPNKIILRGYIIVDSTLFESVCDPDPGNHWLFSGKSPTSVPKIELEVNWKTKADVRKRTRNLVREIFMQISFEVCCQ